MILKTEFHMKHEEWQLEGCHFFAHLGSEHFCVPDRLHTGCSGKIETY